MRPLETPMTDETDSDDIRKAVRQLSFTYQRSASQHREVMEDVMAEALRRAEAVLFAAGEPMSAAQIAEILPQGVEPAQVLMELKRTYAGRGICLAEVAGKWRFQTAEDLSFLFVEERTVQKKLSQAALETLAIIAYGQPVTRAEIEAVRGVAVSKGTIDALMETGWIKTKGRRKTPGRPVTLGTTDKFLEHFGLEDLGVLPGKAELEAEGLLSDVIPDGFSADGEIVSDSIEDDALSVEIPEQEAEFVTDFVSEDEADA
ncbi:MAG: SMC-Scp complex subunit ScpB [Pseudomonadota bacterium]